MTDKGNANVRCSRCEGTGKLFNSQAGRSEPCPACGGTGKVTAAEAGPTPGDGDNTGE